MPNLQIKYLNYFFSDALVKIYELNMSGYIFSSNVTFNKFILYKMKINFNIFYTFMKD